MKKAIQTTSFLSILVAWSVSIVATGLFQIWMDGRVDDFGIIVFWSGLFDLLAWLIFIRPVIPRLKHKKWLFSPYIFPLITFLYAEIVFLILIGWLFLKSGFLVVFFTAGIVGFTFGLAYSLLIQSEGIQNLFRKNEIWRLSVISYPLIFSFLFFWVLPRTSPSIAFRIMPDEIQGKIIARTIPKFKVGDHIDLLLNALPGYLEHLDDGSGNSSASIKGFAYVIQVHCNKIIRLEYGENQNDFDSTIYGNVQNEPCP